MPRTTTENRLSFARFDARRGDTPGFYPGVLVIEKGPAKGHYAVQEKGGRVVNFESDNPEHTTLQKYPIHIGDATLDDVVRCGVVEEVTKCKLDHGDKAKDIIGDYENFRRDGDQVRADLTLLAESPQTSFVSGLINRLAKKIGNSIDFDYCYEIKGNVAIARCSKLNSVDIVDSPAATNSLFQEQPQKPAYDMPLSPEDLAAIRGVIKEEVAASMAAATAPTKTETQLSDEGDKGKTDEEKEKDKADANAMLSRTVKTAALAAIREVLPQATLQSLATLGAGAPKGGDSYETKFAEAKALGMSDAEATRFMARKHAPLYNAKFGAGTANNAKL